MGKGGKREGSGRKPGGPGSSRVSKLLRIEPDVLADLDAEAQEKGRTRSDVVNERLRRKKKAKPRS